MDESSVRECCKSSNYAFTGKLMLISVVVVVFVCVFLVFFHVFARRGFRLRRHGGFLEGADGSSPQGLHQSVQESLPTFVHSSSERHDGSLPECSVCLSELRDNETGRVLPECEHCFHADCIDAWFRSHTNCPLCRAKILSVKNPVQLLNQIGLEPKPEPFDGESRKGSTSSSVIGY